MKLAIISDIHSNLEALNMAFATIDAREVDAIYCLGDVVGYGADASECTDLVMRRCAGVVRGNHDEAVAMEKGVSWLPRDAQKAAKHNRGQLNDKQLAFLAELPLVLTENGCTFVHASPQAPDMWLRIDNFGSALQQFDYFDTDFCFVGHTHIPAIMSDRLGVLRIRPGHRYLINVGSVGQPRDQDPRLAVAFFDTDTLDYELVRIPYNVEAAEQRIRSARLPRRLGKRLRTGV